MYPIYITWWFWIWRVIIGTLLMYFFRKISWEWYLDAGFYCSAALDPASRGRCTETWKQYLRATWADPPLWKLRNATPVAPSFLSSPPQDSIQTWSARVRMNKRAKCTEMPRTDNLSGGISLWSGSHRLSIHEGNSHWLDFSLKKDKQTNWLCVFFFFITSL